MFSQVPGHTHGLGTFGMYPICYRQVSGGYLQPEPAMYSTCFCQFPGPLAPSDSHLLLESLVLRFNVNDLGSEGPPFLLDIIHL